MVPHAWCQDDRVAFSWVKLWHIWDDVLRRGCLWCWYDDAYDVFMMMLMMCLWWCLWCCYDDAYDVDMMMLMMCLWWCLWCVYDDAYDVVMMMFLCAMMYMYELDLWLLILTFDL